MGQTLALTFDDAPALEPTPLMTAEVRNARLIAALKKQHVQAAVFAYGIGGGDSIEGRRILADWGEAGHKIGNHTYSHRNLNQIPLQDFVKDFQRCDRMISGLSGYAKWLRFPYLKEGETPEKKNGMIKFLHAAGYHNAYVSVITFDWLIDQHMRSALKKNPSTPLRPYRTYYLQHVISSARRAEVLSKSLNLGDPPLVVLLHDNLLNALFIDDLIISLKNNGFTLTSPAEAYSHPIYQTTYSRPDAGEGLLWGIASERSVPAEKNETRFALEEAALKELGL